MDPQTLDRFHSAYELLLVCDLQERLGIVNGGPKLNSSDARLLIAVASALALGPSTFDELVEADWKRWAYDAATRLADSKVQVDPRYRRAAELILSRLGNFPGRDFLRDRLSDANGLARYPPVLMLEALTHEAENTVEFHGLGQRTLTDFQLKLIDSLRRARSVSVSAPTSAGKSYLLSLDIVSIVASGSAKVVVYIVPTRALIRQVMTDLLAKFREAGLANVAVSGAPVLPDQSQLSKGTVTVYVLTQERLLSLLHSPEGQLEVDALYVDEAQEIGDDDRGMILHTAVRQVIDANPRARVCFASPLTRNPGFLLNEFEITKQGEFFIERQTPVSQIVVVLDEVRDMRQAIDISILTPLGLKGVARLPTNFKFRGVTDRLARTAVLITKPDESTIIYANGAAEAIDIALKIADLIDNKVQDQEVTDLIDFIRVHIHLSYALVDTLPKGVAFHYGKMPHLVRAQIEDLLRRRKLRYVVCTSTLLQGINLPAKNIVIQAPRKGNDKPMMAPDFWNLAGRAGRLRETFSGYVWCICPRTWENDPLAGDQLSEMKSSFRANLEDEQVGEALIEVLDGTVPLSKVNNRNRVEQLLGKIFSEFTCQNLNLSQSAYVQDMDRQRLAKVDAKCAIVLNSLQVPREVCRRNTVVSPLSLDRLWLKFTQSQIESLIPIDPIRSGALERMRDIFQIIDEIFIGSGNRSWLYYATLAYWWVSGQSLKDLIDSHLKHEQVPTDRKAINKAIRGFLDSLEQHVRFVYVKYLKAYIDTLQEYLTRTNRVALMSSISPLHLYIEYGARDRVLVMLMSLGLSRTTAIFVRAAITSEASVQRDECWLKLRSLPLAVMNIPAVCKREIRLLTGGP